MLQVIFTNNVYFYIIKSEKITCSRFLVLVLPFPGLYWQFWDLLQILSPPVRCQQVRLTQEIQATRRRMQWQRNLKNHLVLAEVCETRICKRLCLKVRLLHLCLGLLKFVKLNLQKVVLKCQIATFVPGIVGWVHQAPNR